MLFHLHCAAPHGTQFHNQTIPFGFLAEFLLLFFKVSRLFFFFFLSNQSKFVITHPPFPPLRASFSSPGIWKPYVWAETPQHPPQYPGQPGLRRGSLLAGEESTLQAGAGKGVSLWTFPA